MSITVSKLKSILDTIPDDYEVMMFCKHKYDISKETGEKGWYAYINSVKKKDEVNEVYLMN